MLLPTESAEDCPTAVAVDVAAVDAVEAAVEAPTPETLQVAVVDAVLATVDRPAAVAVQVPVLEPVAVAVEAPTAVAVPALDEAALEANSVGRGRYATKLERTLDRFGTNPCPLGSVVR